VIRSQPMPFSMRLDRRVPALFGVLLALTVLTLVVSIGYGDYPIAPIDVVKTLLQLDTGNADHAFIVYVLRLPRTIVAFLVGMGLAVSGAILQGLARNPLAAPEIVGVNAGASLVAVTLIVALPGLPLILLPIAAFAGALVAALLIYILAWSNGSAPMRLILVGVGVSAVAGSLTSLMITFGNIYDVSQALVWLTGSVYGRQWEHIQALLPWLLVFLPLTVLLARDLNTLALGDEVARGLGSRVEWQRGLLLISSVALAGSSVAIAGTIGFVGLMAPHLSRQLVGASHEGLIPVTAMTGGVIVMLADLVGRSLFAPIELPCGVVTAAVGAPYFLYLLYRNYAQ
jgi:iron complex transport system permease protein